MSQMMLLNISHKSMRGATHHAGSDGSMSASGQAGPGFDPRRGSKLSFENFSSSGLEGVEGDVHFIIARLYITGLDEIPNPSAVAYVGLCWEGI